MTHNAPVSVRSSGLFCVGHDIIEATQYLLSKAGGWVATSPTLDFHGQDSFRESFEAL